MSSEHSTPVRRPASSDGIRNPAFINGARRRSNSGSSEDQSKQSVKMAASSEADIIEFRGTKSSTVAARTLTLLQLLLLNSVVCGLEFCASAAFTFIPPMLLKAGLDEEHMSIVLGVGPLLGFFLVPVIGRASDQCSSRYGRRRPFILALGMLLILSLLIIPYGQHFVAHFIGDYVAYKTIGVWILITGAVLLDFTSQACLTPCEALLSDATRNTSQQERCFTVYSFMVSIGGCIGYLITALDWSKSSFGLYFGGQEASVFTLLVFLFSATLFCTLGVADERPLDLEEEGEESDLDKVEDKTLLEDPRSIKDILGIPVASIDPGYESSSNRSETDEYSPLSTRNAVHKQRTSRFRWPRFLKQCNIPLTRWSFTTLKGFLHFLRLRLYSLLPENIRILLNVPFVLQRLAVANFCSWTAVMGFNLFYTDFVGQSVYGGNPNAEEDSVGRASYDEGVRMGSWGLLLHCIVSAISAPFIERLVLRFGHIRMYFMGLFSFSVAMSMMFCFRSIFLVNLMAACTGFAYATVTTIPFMLINNYHTKKEVFFYDLHTMGGKAASRGIASDMAIVDSAYFLSQVMLSMCMGYIVTYSGTVLAYVVTSGAMGLVACVCITRIINTEQLMNHHIKSNRVRPLAAVAPSS